MNPKFRNRIKPKYTFFSYGDIIELYTLKNLKFQYNHKNLKSNIIIMDFNDNIKYEYGRCNEHNEVVTFRCLNRRKYGCRCKILIKNGKFCVDNCNPSKNHDNGCKSVGRRDFQDDKTKVEDQPTEEQISGIQSSSVRIGGNIYQLYPSPKKIKRIIRSGKYRNYNVSNMSENPVYPPTSVSNNFQMGYNTMNMNMNMNGNPVYAPTSVSNNFQMGYNRMNGNGNPVYAPTSVSNNFQMGYNRMNGNGNPFYVPSVSNNFQMGYNTMNMNMNMNGNPVYAPTSVSNNFQMGYNTMNGNGNPFYVPSVSNNFQMGYDRNNSSAFYPEFTHIDSRISQFDYNRELKQRDLQIKLLKERLSHKNNKIKKLNQKFKYYQNKSEMLDDKIDEKIKPLKDEMGNYTLETAFLLTLKSTTLSLSLRNTINGSAIDQRLFINLEKDIQKIPNASTLYYLKQIIYSFSRKLIFKQLKKVNVIFEEFDLSTKFKRSFLDGIFRFWRGFEHEEQIVSLRKRIITLNQKMIQCKEIKTNMSKQEIKSRGLKYIHLGELLIQAQRYLRLKGCPDRIAWLYGMENIQKTGESLHKFMVEKANKKLNDKIIAFTIDKGPKVSKAARLMKKLILKCNSHTIGNYIMNIIGIVLGCKSDKVSTHPFVCYTKRFCNKWRKEYNPRIKILNFLTSELIENFTNVSLEEFILLFEKISSFEKSFLIDNLIMTRWLCFLMIMFYISTYYDKIMLICKTLQNVDIEERNRMLKFSEILSWLKEDLTKFRCTILGDAYIDIIKPMFIDVHRYKGYNAPYMQIIIKNWDFEISNLENKFNYGVAFKKTKKLGQENEMFRGLAIRYFKEFREAYVKKRKDHWKFWEEWPYVLFGCFTHYHNINKTNATQLRKNFDNIVKHDVDDSKFLEIYKSDNFEKLCKGECTVESDKVLRRFLMDVVEPACTIADEGEGIFSLVNGESPRSSTATICRNIFMKANLQFLNLKSEDLQSSKLINKFRKIRKKVLTNIKKFKERLKMEVLESLKFLKFQLDKGNSIMEIKKQKVKLISIFHYFKQKAMVPKDWEVRTVRDFTVNKMKHILSQRVDFPPVDSNGKRKKILKTDLEELIIKHFDETVKKDNIAIAIQPTSAKTLNDEADACAESIVLSEGNQILEEITSESKDEVVVEKEIEINHKKMYLSSKQEAKMKEPFLKDATNLKLVWKFLKKYEYPIFGLIKRSVVNQPQSKLIINPDETQLQSILRNIRKIKRKSVIYLDLEFYYIRGVAIMLEAGIYIPDLNLMIWLYCAPPRDCPIHVFHLNNLFLKDEFPEDIFKDEKDRNNRKRRFYNNSPFCEFDILSICLKLITFSNLLCIGHYLDSADYMVLFKVCLKYNCVFKLRKVKFIDDLYYLKFLIPTGHSSIQNILFYLGMDLIEKHKAPYDSLYTSFIHIKLFGSLNLVIQHYWSLWDKFNEENQPYFIAIKYYDNPNHQKFYNDANLFCKEVGLKCLIGKPKERKERESTIYSAFKTDYEQNFVYIEKSENNKYCAVNLVLVLDQLKEFCGRIRVQAGGRKLEIVDRIYKFVIEQELLNDGNLLLKLPFIIINENTMQEEEADSIPSHHTQDLSNPMEIEKDDSISPQKSDDISSLQIRITSHQTDQRMQIDENDKADDDNQMIDNTEQINEKDEQNSTTSQKMVDEKEEMKDFIVDEENDENEDDDYILDKEEENEEENWVETESTSDDDDDE